MCRSRHERHSTENGQNKADTATKMQRWKVVPLEENERNYGTFNMN